MLDSAKKHRRLLLLSGASFLILTTTCFMLGLGVVLARGDNHDYREAEQILGRGKCGQREFSWHGRSLKVTYYRCYVTTNDENSVKYWYAKNGYRFENSGQMVYNQTQLGIEVTQRERVYTYLDGNNTIIRIYDDTIVHIPTFASLTGRP